MNNNITEDYCSPKVSSLLEEKGMARGAWLVPTQALAIKWIRENFNIWYSIGMQSKDYFTLTIYRNNPDITIIYNDKGFKTSEEAINAALLYTLKHLI